LFFDWYVIWYHSREVSRLVARRSGDADGERVSAQSDYSTE
jgi:hypothetical protein